MPLKIWDSPPIVERAPLSTPNQDEDEEDDFVPYSDRPTSTSDDGNHSSNNGNTKTIVIEEDDAPPQRKSECSDDYVDNNSRYEDEYGDLSYSNQTFQASKQRHYRTSLVCAYIRHCFKNRLIRRICSLVFFLFVMIIMISCASAIGYIISQEGNPFVSDGNDEGNGNIPKFVPPSPNLHNICSDWVTISGRRNCQSYCDNAKCCALPENDKDSCWKEHIDDCAEYRSACMALELHSAVANSGGSMAGDVGTNEETSSGIGSLASAVELPPPPANLMDMCSVSSLSTPEGFSKCSDICRPSRCCNPNEYECTLKDDASKIHCSVYESPCKSVVETWRGSGHGDSLMGEGNLIANQVMEKCNADK